MTRTNPATARGGGVARLAQFIAGAGALLVSLLALLTVAAPAEASPVPAGSSTLSAVTDNIVHRSTFVGAVVADRGRPVLAGRAHFYSAVGHGTGGPSARPSHSNRVASRDRPDSAQLVPCNSEAGTTAVGHTGGTEAPVTVVLRSGVAAKAARPMFHPDDFALGLDDAGRLRDFARANGVRYYNDLDDIYPGMPFSNLTSAIDETVASGGRLHFNLDGIKGVDDILNAPSDTGLGYTARELRYVCGNATLRASTVFQGGSAPC